jgi:hypothetical protein
MWKLLARHLFGGRLSVPWGQIFTFHFDKTTMDFGEKNDNFPFFA